MLAEFALAALTGANAANKANIAGARASARSFDNAAMGWEENLAQNQAIEKMNVQNTIRSGYRTGMLNLQRAQAKKLAIANGTDMLRNKLQVLGAATANAAAAGQIGSSVDAVAQDIESKAFEAESNRSADWDIQTQNFDTQMRDLLQSGQDMLRSAATANVQEGTRYNPISDTEVLVGAALNVGSQYLSAKMNLGLGQSTAKPADVNPQARR